MRRLGSLLMACAEKSAVPRRGRPGRVTGRSSPAWPPRPSRASPASPWCGRRSRTSPRALWWWPPAPSPARRCPQKIQQLCGGQLELFSTRRPPSSPGRAWTWSTASPPPATAGGTRTGRRGTTSTAPMNKAEYDAFQEALVTAQRAPVHSFDVRDPKVYEGCMPIEVLASRGHDAIRFGPMKPVGLRGPPHRPPALGGAAAAHREPGAHPV